FFGWLVLMPSFLEDVWGYSPLAAGFALALSPVLSGVVSPIAGRAADRIGHRGLVAGGALASAAGIVFWIMAIGPTPAYWTAIVPGSILMGIGGGTGFATLTGGIMRDVPARFYSMAGAARSTVFQLGSAIGIAIAVALVGTPADGEVAPYARTWAFGAVGAI